MDLVGRVDGVTYMLPFYNYAMGLTYRKDLLEDPQHQQAFKAKYGMDLKVPTELGRVSEAGGLLQRGGGMPNLKGVVNQGLRPDPIAMEWSNYLFARGGRYYDESWKPELTSAAAVQALEDYKTNVQKYGPVGVRELQLRRGLQRRGPGAGLQLHHLQHVPRRL